MRELNVSETKEASGGIIGLLIVAAACLLLGGCATVNGADGSELKPNKKPQ